MRTTLTMLAACAIASLLPACAVGPTATQNAKGQVTANSPLNTVNMLQTPAGDNTFNANGAGPVRESMLDKKGVEVRSVGIVPRSVTYTNGESHFALDSGSDVSAEGVEVTFGSGGVPSIKVAKFSTSSSEPLRALNEALDRYKDVWAKLSEEQRKQVEAQMEAIKVVSPPLLEAIKAVLVGP